MRAKREIDIISYLKNHGAVHLQELSDLLQVSKNTIRRDLKSLESQGIVRIKRGGAVLHKELPLGISLDEREIQFIEEKHRIGEQANLLIPDNASIVLDAGTTTEQIARSLRGKKGLTVITNALNILFRLVQIPDIMAISTGGVINPITRCFTGYYAEQFLSQFHVDLAFISAGGVTERGVTNTNTLEVPMKKIMLQIADKVVLVVTHDKLGKTSLAQFATLNQIDLIITDDQADPEIVKQFQKMGKEIILC